MEGQTDSEDTPPTCDQLLSRAVGTCPVVELSICGVTTKGLLDTGSQVSTITDPFFRDHLRGKDDDVLSMAGWLKLTAANGLDIPYLGYLELEVEAMGMEMSDCGFLVVKDETSASSPENTVSCILGMNIISRCRQLVQAEFDATLGGKLDSDSRHFFQKVQTSSMNRKSFVYLAGKWTERIPAESVVTITATGFNGSVGEGCPMLLEPLSTLLPGGLVVIPILIDSHCPCIPFKIQNFSQEDVCLLPRTRLGILSKVKCVDSSRS